MPRFVILHHQTPKNHPRKTHWDFMIEVGPTLRTWALEEELAPGKSVQAEQLADHRIAYLTYEGPISGDRGAVTQWDAGEYEMQEESLERVVLSLRGKRCRGTVTLSRRQQPGGDTQRWSVSLRNS